MGLPTEKHQIMLINVIENRYFQCNKTRPFQYTRYLLTYLRRSFNPETVNRTTLQLKLWPSARLSTNHNTCNWLKALGGPSYGRTIVTPERIQMSQALACAACWGTCRQRATKKKKKVHRYIFRRTFHLYLEFELAKKWRQVTKS